MHLYMYLLRGHEFVVHAPLLPQPDDYVSLWNFSLCNVSDSLQFTDLCEVLCDVLYFIRSHECDFQVQQMLSGALFVCYHI
jgi:hypothetical protein